MELWRLPLQGITSEDFLSQQGNNEVRAFYGALWRFKDDTRMEKTVELPQEDKEKPSRSLMLNNELIDDAKKMGHPISMPDTGYSAEHRRNQAEYDKINADNQAILQDIKHQQGEDSDIFSKEELNNMSIPQLKEHAANIGIVNLNVSKQKLVDLILEKQN